MIATSRKGRVGKITVAQILRHVDVVLKSFELRLWVFVLDVLLTTTILLQAIPLETCKLSDDLNLLQLMLREKLSGKRCLIILDDVCKVDSTEQWDLLCRPLSAAFQPPARGVKIVITTRNDGVPSFMGGFSHHHLEALSEYDCLSVFAHHVLEKQNLMQSKSASFWVRIAS